MRLAPADRISAVYVVAGAAWIVASDYALWALGIDHDVPQTAKGLLFIAVTAVLLRILLKRAFAARDARAGALRETARRYELATAGSAVGVWDWDLAGGSIYWSPELRRLLRLPDGAPACRVADLVHPDDRERALAAETGHLRDGTPYDVEMRLRCGDGTYRWFHGRGSAVRDAERGPVRMVGSLTDITARREAAAQLAAAREAAELANRAKTAFLASMSHELRTPLNAIIGFSEVIAAETFGPVGDPRYADYARDIGDSGLHLLDVLNNILDAARIESGSFELQDETIDLAAEIPAAVRQLEAADRGRRIAVALELDGAPVLRADRRAVRQMLLNVVGNAMKFSPEGGRVAVSVETGPEGLAILVADSGPGIADAVARSLGRPFVQGDPALRRRHGGSGLGLYVVGHLLERHGGRLEIGRAAEGGALVRLRFPADRVGSA